jgi:hypothetical protein
MGMVVNHQAASLGMVVSHQTASCGQPVIDQAAITHQEEGEQYLISTYILFIKDTVA